jgi:hypothetical protein
MISMFASSAIYRGFEPRSGQTKDCKIGICCFAAKHTAFRRKSKDWLGIRIMCSSGRYIYLWTVVLVSQHYKNPTKLVGLVQSGPHLHLIAN